MNLIASIWLCGVAVLLVYAAVSYVHIRRKVRESVRIEGNIYICDRIQTPFIFGVLNPRIYLPSSLKEVQIKNVVAHGKSAYQTAGLSVETTWLCAVCSILVQSVLLAGVHFVLPGH